IGLLVLVLLLWSMNAFSKANQTMIATQLSRVAQPLFGVAALALGGFITLRGNEAGIALILVGCGLLGLMPFTMPFSAGGLFRRAQKSAGQVSRVRSAFLEMELDHDSGAMRGRLLAGRHEGAALDALDVDTLIGLMDEIDAESRALLAAYLDRR